MKKINTVAIELIKESQAVIDAAKNLKKGFSFAKLRSVAREVCVVVETYTDEVGELSSQSKVSLGVELLVNLVDIPFVPQWIERKIYNIALDNALDFLNERFGKDWLNRFTEKVEAKTDVVAKISKHKIIKTVSDVIIERVDEADKIVQRKAREDIRANLKKRTGLL